MGIYYFFSGFDGEKGFTPEISQSLRTHITGKKSLVFIASNPHGHEKTDFYTKHQTNWFCNAGIVFETVHILDDRKTQQECAQIIQNASAIFLCGGTTLLQIDFIRQYNLIPMLKQFSGVIMGISAGAINMATRSFCSPEGEQNSTALVHNGVGLADVSVEPHFSIDYAALLDDHLLPMSNQIDIYALCDNSAIVVDDGKRQYFGDIYLVSKGAISKIPAETEQMELVFPTMEHKQAAFDYRQEHINCGEAHIHGSGGFMHADNYESWLEKIEWNKTQATPDWVTGSVYFAIAGDKIVGSIAIRNYLNESLLKTGGHIGYGIRPSERRKGYGTKMLALALEKCREQGIDKALVTCDKSNIASAKTAMRNGGVLENEVTEENGNIVQRYWITV